MSTLDFSLISHDEDNNEVFIDGVDSSSIKSDEFHIEDGNLIQAFQDESSSIEVNIS
jgi:hypothetical protein